VPPVAFYLPKLSDPTQYDHVDPDTDWSLFKNARGQWIPHTYVRLRKAGADVAITSEPPTRGIVVVFAGDMRRFLARHRSRRDLVVVCAQADRRTPEAAMADVVVHHNGVRANAKRHFFIPNWPQAGLVPRDPQRGTTLQTVAYKGHLDNLRSEFLSPEWEAFLRRQGLQFVLDCGVPEGDPRLRGLRDGISIGSTARWNDYTDVDLVLAVRPPRRDRYRHKPAVKLINAWRAQTPALLGPERAYRELRRSDLDYLEVSSPREAMRAVERLRDDPELYARMIANGARRSTAFSVEGIVRQWEHLLFSVLPEHRPNRAFHIVAKPAVPLRRGVRALRRRVGATA
jgi:hypothetical protein